MHLGVFYSISCLALAQAQVSNTNYLVPSWQPGDIRLVNGTSSSNGVVQIYLDLKNGIAGWGTLCNQVASSFSTATICRQLGYYVSNPPAPINGPPVGNPVWLINDWQCSEAYSHVLQCVTWDNINRTPQNPPASCLNHDMWVDCGTTAKSTYAPSINDVQLYRDPQGPYINFTSFGGLRVYLTANGMPDWGFVTNDIFSTTPFTIAAANSACRQLGYTGALNYGMNATSPNSQNQLTWIPGSKCQSRSYQCFSCCFDPPSRVCGKQCEISTAVFLQCTYDLASLGVYKPETCSDKSAGECQYLEKQLVLALGITLGFALFAIIVILVIVGIIVFLLRHIIRQMCKCKKIVQAQDGANRLLPVNDQQDEYGSTGTAQE